MKAKKVNWKQIMTLTIDSSEKSGNLMYVVVSGKYLGGTRFKRIGTYMSPERFKSIDRELKLNNVLK